MVFIKVIFGSSEDMKELSNSNVNLIVISSPYFNAPFDFQPGRYACYVTQIRYFYKIHYIIKYHRGC